MARKIFISYKYSEAIKLRDDILIKLGKDAQYYQGETSDSPDLTDTSTENIKRNLRDMMYDSSITIVIISPNMSKSKWINWELEYCLKQIPREDRVSRTNGIIGVLMEVNGNYDWIKEEITNCHGNPAVRYNDEYLYPIIIKNRYNSKPSNWHCDNCRTFDRMKGSYISLINQSDFLNNPQYFIEDAFSKKEIGDNGYGIIRQIK